MCLHVCMHVCMYVCVYVCKCIYIYIDVYLLMCQCICMCVCMCICICLYMYVYIAIYIYLYIYTHYLFMFVYTYVYLHIHIHIFTIIYIYIYIYVFVVVYIKSVLSWVFTDKRWNMWKAKVFWVNICCTLFSHISLITPPTCPCFITVSSRTGLDLRTCSKWSCTKHAWTRYGDHVTRCDMVKALKHLAKRYETLNSLMAKHCKKWQDVAKHCQIPCRSVKLHFTWTNI